MRDSTRSTRHPSELAGTRGRSHPLGAAEHPVHLNRMAGFHAHRLCQVLQQHAVGSVHVALTLGSG
jgi:hypothetical protein